MVCNSALVAQGRARDLCGEELGQVLYPRGLSPGTLTRGSEGIKQETETQTHVHKRWGQVGCGQAVNIWEEEEAVVIRLCKHWPLIHTQIPEKSLESGKAQMGNGFYSSPDPQGLVTLT